MHACVCETSVGVCMRTHLTRVCVHAVIPDTPFTHGCVVCVHVCVCVCVRCEVRALRSECAKSFPRPSSCVLDEEMGADEEVCVFVQCETSVGLFVGIYTYELGTRDKPDMCVCVCVCVCQV